VGASAGDRQYGAPFASSGRAHAQPLGLVLAKPGKRRAGVCYREPVIDGLEPVEQPRSTTQGITSISPRFARTAASPVLAGAFPAARQAAFRICVGDASARTPAFVSLSEVELAVCAMLPAKSIYL
jgi:hypothetical protein